MENEGIEIRPLESIVSDIRDTIKILNGLIREANDKALKVTFTQAFHPMQQYKPENINAPFEVKFTKEY